MINMYFIFQNKMKCKNLLCTDVAIYGYKCKKAMFCIKCKKDEMVKNPLLYCEHMKIKYNCKECHGSSLCNHGKIKYKCKDCNGSSLCDHGKRKSRCVECGGSELCEHGKRREYCKDCAGSQICEHREYKYNCKECLSNKRKKLL